MGTHYFDEQPDTTSAEREVVVGVVSPPLRLVTDRGVFGYGQLDTGTEFLLRQAPPPPSTGTFLDLGCGTGAIAVTLGRRSPDARIIGVDVNERARSLTARNAAANDVANVTALAPDDPAATAARYDLIWSNPPIRIGKAALHELLLTWLERLTDDGRAILVVHKHLGSDSLQRWLTEHSWPTERIASSKGYRLLRVRRA